MFAKHRAKEQGAADFFDPGYTTLILGAYMMHVGAKIEPEDRQHLKDIFPKIPSKNGYVMPLWDNGFRDPGQVQYKAALENYVDGNPRSFFDARQSIPKSTNSILTLSAASIVARHHTTLLPLNSNVVSLVTKTARQLHTATESARKRTGRNTRRSVDDQNRMDPSKC